MKTTASRVPRRPSLPHYLLQCACSYLNFSSVAQVVSSLCHLCVLCASVVHHIAGTTNHRDTEKRWHREINHLPNSDSTLFTVFSLKSVRGLYCGGTFREINKASSNGPPRQSKIGRASCRE